MLTSLRTESGQCHYAWTSYGYATTVPGSELDACPGPNAGPWHVSYPNANRFSDAAHADLVYPFRLATPTPRSSIETSFPAARSRSPTSTTSTT